MRSILLMSLKVLGRRPFFTFVSFFGIAFTLTTLLVVASLLDGLLAPKAPEIHMDRTLMVGRVNLWNDQSDFYGTPGYKLVDDYLRDLPHVEITTVFTTTSTDVSFVQGRRVETDVRRTDAAYWTAFAFEFVEGSAFNASDVDGARAVIVIDQSTRRAFFGDGAAVGRTLELGDRGYEVVGVVRDVDALRNATVANAWAPLTTHPNAEWRHQIRGDFQVCLVARSADDFPAIRAEIAARFDQWQPLPDGRFESARAVPMTRLEEIVAETMQTPSREEPDTARFWLLATGAVFLFMLLPAVNLINVNMSRILERASEIGVRKAFGASNAALILQFVIENVVLCLLGGAVSFVLAGFLTKVASAAGWTQGAVLEPSLRVFLAGLALALIFGALSGIVPAWRMARLHPVQALRGGER